jgi:hypothetical protein
LMVACILTPLVFVGLLGTIHEASLSMGER